jgi:SET domain-containing protein|tara:strand:- start:233 stop:523 length:291 start_codon:yes stop_codon:yes gene_type:complete
MTYKPLPNFLTIKPSTIEGLGIFATDNIKKGTNLGMIHFLHNEETFRTPLGGFLNHSLSANCLKVQLGNKKYLTTKQNINKGEELTLTYTMYNPDK